MKVGLCEKQTIDLSIAVDRTVSIYQRFHKIVLIYTDTHGKQREGEIIRQK